MKKIRIGRFGRIVRTSMLRSASLHVSHFQLKSSKFNNRSQKLPASSQKANEITCSKEWSSTLAPLRTGIGSATNLLLTLDEKPQVTMDEDLRDRRDGPSKGKSSGSWRLRQGLFPQKQIDTLKSGTNLPTSEADQNEAPARVRPSVNTTIGQWFHNRTQDQRS